MWDAHEKNVLLYEKIAPKTAKKTSRIPARECWIRMPSAVTKLTPIRHLLLILILIMSKTSFAFIAVLLALVRESSSWTIPRPEWTATLSITETPPATCSTSVAQEPAHLSRHRFLTTLLVVGVFCANPTRSLALGEDQVQLADENTLELPSVDACPKVAQGSNNCISTASVRQLDLYMAPWTYPKDMPNQEVIARIKGAVNTNNRLEVVGQTDYSLKVQAIRNFCKDEILFLLNPKEHVITFVSKQVDGPDAPDFGENRKRLEDIRRRVGVVGVMGEDFSYMDNQKEGAFGQLKAFYGLRSGRGFEDVLLDEE